MPPSQADATERTDNVELRSPRGKDTAEKVQISSKDQYTHDSEPPNQDVQAMLAPAALQKWNEPRGNVARFAASFYSIFVFGLSDAAYGALIPYVRLTLLDPQGADLNTAGRVL